MNPVKNYVLNGSDFDIGRWDHWLFILCFLIISAWGLWLSWQWCHAPKRRRNKRKLYLDKTITSRRDRKP